MFLHLVMLVVLQNGTGDPVITRDFVLSLPPTFCVKKEESAGLVDFYKTCGDGCTYPVSSCNTFSLSVKPGNAEEIIIKVFYWSAPKSRQVLSKEIRMPVSNHLRDVLVTTGVIPVEPTLVKALEITLNAKGKRIDKQKIVYSHHAPEL